MTDTNPAKFKKLVTLLKELFQLDQPDLDFGIYRIMHAKAGEVTQFLERDLLPQVKDAFSRYQSADSAEMKRRLDQMVAQLAAADVDPEQSPKVRELREQLKGASDIGALENEVYDDLYSFFRRYYSEGDFLAKRVYKPGVYAIPYEGEEVTLHWANKDQYYIKTSEYLRDYAFRLRPDAAEGEDPMRVHFRLVDAAEGEHGNVKAAEGKDRVFVLAKGDFIGVSNGELDIRFEYRPATLEDWPEGDRAGKRKPPAQKELTALAVDRILASSVDFKNWLAELKRAHVKSDGEQADYTRLEAHLRRYTARNTFDYFIHKDLGGFLRRELDFYIKNEVMHLDDVENDSAPKVEQYLSKIKVIRRIAGKIIDFLAQLENFQKKLWLKKKFVVGSNWLVAISQVPDELLPVVCANAAQLEEWKALHALHELPVDVTRPAYSEPLTPEFLRSCPSLMVDTRNFDAISVARLIEIAAAADNNADGLLIHSENFQALSLLQARYREKVQCIYIDPPYNTGADGFAYKDAYKDSSWTSFLSDRLSLARTILGQRGVIFSSINEIERANLDWLFRMHYGAENRIEEVIWVRDTLSNNSPAYSTNHEYVEVFARNRSLVEAELSMFRETKPGFNEVMNLVEPLVAERPSLKQVEEKLATLYAEHKARHLESSIESGVDRDEALKNDPWKGLYPYKRAEYRDESGVYLDEETARSAQSPTIWIWREVEPSMPAGKQAASIKDPASDNYRFFRPLHPLTNQPCKAPKRGWAFPEKAVGQRPSFEKYVADNRISFKASHESIPQQKYFLHEVESIVSTSVIRQYADGEPKLEALFGVKGLVDNPKPPGLVERFVRQTTRRGDIVFDFFGGSGTTGHSVVNTNRESGERRLFMLTEQAAYFHTVLVPRIKKVTFSPEWANGKPSRMATPSEVVNGPKIVKVLQLETYEDTLNNLNLQRSMQQQAALDFNAAKDPDGMREQYLLRYQLDVESRGSASLLNIRSFTDPTAYKLKVKTPGGDESREVNVDLLETFNWLLGLTVQQITAPRSFRAEFERDEEGRLQLKGRLRQSDDGPFWFRTVTGTTPEGRKTLVIWRKLTGEPEQDNLVLEEWFKTKQAYSVRDTEFDLIYVNGDNTLENLRVDPETWKVRLIEEDFHRLMFEGTEA